MAVFFTSDHHFGHAKIIEYSNRISPKTGVRFADVHEMNEYMVEAHNAKVKPGDLVYFLGDVAQHNRELKEFAPRLNGTKILIWGNHDHRLNKKLFPLYFPAIHAGLEVKVKLGEVEQSIYLHHYSCRVWNKSHLGAWHLFGHSHGTLPPYGLSFDCGVDTNQFSPYSVDDIAKKMSTLTPIHSHVNREDSPED